MNFTLTEEQQNAYNNLLTFVNNQNKQEFLLIGYAGCGKTTLITNFVYDLLDNNKKIVIVAPTHQASSVVKSKFSENSTKQTKSENSTKQTKSENSTKQIKKVEIKTIHQLLNYVQYFDEKGNKFFAEGKYKNNWNDYDIVIIDECSMLTTQIINDIKKRLKNNNKIKIIYVGDPAQLPPINQVKSDIFNDNLIERIELTNVIRTNNNTIINLSKKHRDWIFSDDMKLTTPKLMDYKCDNIKIYKNNTEKELWFNSFINLLNENQNNKIYSNIILSWTNNICNEYNEYVRKKIFNKQILHKYEIGEIIIFSDFHRINIIKDNNIFNNNFDMQQDEIMEIETINFHTSEQVKIVNCLEMTLKLNKFKQYKIDLTNKHNKKIDEKLAKFIENQNILFDKEYKIYQLTVNKNNCNVNYQIFIFNDEKEYDEILKTFEENILNLIEKLNVYINNIELTATFTNAKIIELKGYLNTKINSIRKYLHEKILNKYAHINYGYAITVHKSQGSTFENAFIDIRDIITNNNKLETAKMLYTSITRASNTINLLI
jgi:hypothetical protein